MREKLIDLIGAVQDYGEKGIPHSMHKQLVLNSLVADHLIANNVVIQKHGKWVRKPTGKLIAFSKTNVAPEYKEFCSLCDVPNKHYKPPYCPHCGADMRGEEREID